MAKKKRKRRPQGGSIATSTATAGQRSARTDRKELARQEREALQRRMRRRRRMRRLLIWGAVLLVVVAVVLYFVLRNRQESAEDEEIAAIAERIGCQAAQEDLPDEGQGHLQAGEPAPTYGQVPATSGRHSGTTLPPDIQVYDDPVPEEQAVHNLEHGYVLIYYNAEAIDEGVLDSLTALAEDEEEVILAPYPSLPEGETLAMVAWNNAQHCSLVEDASSGEVETVVREFISDFKNGADAPEAPAP